MEVDDRRSQLFRIERRGKKYLIQRKVLKRYWVFNNIYWSNVTSDGLPICFKNGNTNIPLRAFDEFCDANYHLINVILSTMQKNYSFVK